MQKYSIISLIKMPFIIIKMGSGVERPSPKKEYDVVIIGGVDMV